MQLRYSFRIHPTAGQCKSLARAFGCARVVWNDALRLRQDAHAAGLPFPRSADLSKSLITQAKKTAEREWLSGAPVGVLQQSLRDQDQAWRNFFDSVKGKRPGLKVEPPRFKTRRDNRQSARYTRSDRWSVTEADRLRLPKVGDIKVTWSRRLPSEPSSVTVVKDPAGRYWASFVVETDPAADLLPEIGADCGIDLGLTHFAITDQGVKIDSPRFLRRAEKKLKKAQRELSRKVRGSRNREKARVKVARAHARVANARKDWQHKLSTRLISENQAVYVETLSVAGLGRTRLAKSVHDAGWAQFVGMLEYKAARYGRTVIRVDRGFPSSRLCSACGHNTGAKPLSVREWGCPHCGTRHDRDVNAARNIRTEGRRIRAVRQHHIPGDVPALTG
ncbi:RNA-guided endonuclease InsQ/TnpB family protein [Kitasatospora sp. NPDC048296]|uniref:RNA-guided endonuclease InsQ/TnpB family protein n=1 Tax=Kitasatospora sp. NPDC048296 TaxID=3364048 RepID=UPI003718368D